MFWFVCIVIGGGIVAAACVWRRLCACEPDDGSGELVFLEGGKLEAPVRVCPGDWYFAQDRINTVTVILAADGEREARLLTASLAATLSDMPEFAGRLTKTLQAGCGLAVVPGRVPVRTVLRPDLQAEDIGRMDAAALAHLADHVATGERLLRGPLTRVRLTALADGVAIGLSVSHVLCDGAGYYRFLTNWSRRHRGLDPLPSSPVRPAAFLAGPPALSFVQSALGWALQLLRRHAAWRPGTGLHRANVTAARLQDMKQQAAVGTEAWVSTNDALSAELAAAVRSSALVVAVNLRSRFPGAPSEEYTGNATGGLLVRQHPRPTAGRIRAGLRSTPAPVPDRAELLRIYACRQRVARVSNWVSFARELDFGAPEITLHLPVQALGCISGHLCDAAHMVVVPAYGHGCTGDQIVVGALDPAEAAAVARALLPKS